MAKLVHSYIDYDPETGKLTWKKSPKHGINVGDEVGWIDAKGYRRFKLFGMNWSAHRYIWLWMVGYIDDSIQIDHVNGIKDDNRWCNIRAATATQNAQNKSIQKSNTTGVKGVCLRPNGKFRARIVVEGVRKSLGDYDTLADAEKVLILAREIYHKEFANHGRW